MSHEKDDLIKAINQKLNALGEPVNNLDKNLADIYKFQILLLQSYTPKSLSFRQQYLKELMERRKQLAKGKSTPSIDDLQNQYDEYLPIAQNEVNKALTKQPIQTVEIAQKPKKTVLLLSENESAKLNNLKKLLQTATKKDKESTLSLEEALRIKRMLSQLFKSSPDKENVFLNIEDAISMHESLSKICERRIAQQCKALQNRIDRYKELSADINHHLDKKDFGNLMTAAEKAKELNTMLSALEDQISRYSEGFPNEDYLN